MTKDDIQKKALELMRESPVLLLEWATGTGKSRAACEIIKDYAVLYTPLRVLLIVAEEAHKENWAKEIEKWEVPDAYKVHITMDCYASLKKHQDTKWDIVIYDEAHHLASELRQSILSTIKSNKVLLLTATMKPEIKQDLLIFYRKMFTYKITMEDAISMGLIPKPEVVVVHLDLDNITRNQEVTEEWGNGKKRKEIRCDYPDRWKYMKDRKTAYPDVKLVISCTEKEKIDYLNDKIEYYSRMFFIRKDKFLKDKWLRLGSERKRTLGGFKGRYAKAILDRIKDKRYICFCSSVGQAEELGSHTCIHSRKKNNAEIIRKFNDKGQDSLFAVGMLQEGQNLVDIEAGIIIQLDGEERGFIQKMGRVVRGEKPIVYILYYRDTKDEDYLVKAMENISPKYVQTISGSEILEQYEYENSNNF